MHCRASNIAPLPVSETLPNFLETVWIEPYGQNRVISAMMVRRNGVRESAETEPDRTRRFPFAGNRNPSVIKANTQPQSIVTNRSGVATNDPRSTPTPSYSTFTVFT